MAFICPSCLPKRSTNLVLMRILKQTYCEQKLMQSASPSKALSSRDAPIKFTTNRASTVKIAETIGLHNNNNKEKNIIAHVIFGSLAVFLIYFCYLREENDLDDILKGNNTGESDRVKVLNMKIKLHYCEKNGLPTQELRAKIQELEEKYQKSPFVK